MDAKKKISSNIVFWIWGLLIALFVALFLFLLALLAGFKIPFFGFPSGGAATQTVKQTVPATQGVQVPVFQTEKQTQGIQVPVFQPGFEKEKITVSVFQPGFEKEKITTSVFQPGFEKEKITTSVFQPGFEKEKITTSVFQPGQIPSPINVLTTKYTYSDELIKEAVIQEFNYQFDKIRLQKQNHDLSIALKAATEGLNKALLEAEKFQLASLAAEKQVQELLTTQFIPTHPETVSKPIMTDPILHLEALANPEIRMAYENALKAKALSETAVQDVQQKRNVLDHIGAFIQDNQEEIKFSLIATGVVATLVGTILFAPALPALAPAVALAL